MENSKVTGMMSKWDSELRSDGLKYEPRPVLVDFIAEFTLGTTEHANSKDES